jgi:lipopolysaccharide transport system ATP-binding protein
MSGSAIHVEKLSKLYQIGSLRQKGGYRTLREQLTRTAAKPFQFISSALRGKGTAPSESSVWALKDVSFDVNKGDVVGVIGRNGAGKSTLLKILTRITEPTRGFAEITGRVASLLEVGTGFHPELTGRENIYLSAAILGMRRAEIERKFDEIVAFAEIEKFIDTNVKHYSSGMYLRLAFAVAAHLEPEILLVDEVLAVGDAAFQKKCLAKMGGIGEQGKTVLFVSHNLAAIEYLCQKGIILQDGKLVFSGTSKEAIDYYLNRIVGSGSNDTNIVDLTRAQRKRSRDRRLLQRLELFTENNKPVTGALKMGGSFTAHIHFKLENPTSCLEAALSFDNLLGQRVFTAQTEYQPDRPQGRWDGEQIFVCEIPSLTLTPGEYKIKLALDIDNWPADTIEDATRLTVVESDYYGTGSIAITGMFVLNHNWRLLPQAPNGNGANVNPTCVEV